MTCWSIGDAIVGDGAPVSGAAGRAPSDTRPRYPMDGSPGAPHKRRGARPLVPAGADRIGLAAGGSPRAGPPRSGRDLLVGPSDVPPLLAERGRYSAGSCESRLLGWAPITLRSAPRSGAA